MLSSAILNRWWRYPCNAFDDETEQGEKLERHDALIEAAVTSIGDTAPSALASPRSWPRRVCRTRRPKLRRFRI